MDERNNSLSGIAKMDKNGRVGVGDSFQGIGKLNPTSQGGSTQPQPKPIKK